MKNRVGYVIVSLAFTVQKAWHRVHRESTEKAQRPRRKKVPGLGVNSKVYCLLKNYKLLLDKGILHSQ